MGLKEKLLGEPYMTAPQYCTRYPQNCEVCKSARPAMPQCVQEAMKKNGNVAFVQRGRVKL